MSTTDLIMWGAVLAVTLFIVQMYADFIKWYQQQERVDDMDFRLAAGVGGVFGLLLIGAMYACSIYLIVR